MIDYLKDKYTAYKNRGFTLIELIVVMVIIAVLVLLAAPRFIGQTEKAQVRNIQNDVKVAELKVSETLIHGLDVWDSWTDVTSDTLREFIREDGTTMLYGKVGPIYDRDEVEDEDYKALPDKFIKREVRSRLEGTFYANKNGTVYYESGVVRQGEADKEKGQEQGETDKKEPGYSDEEIRGLIDEGYIPVATANELNNVRNATLETYGKGTKWEGPYTGGFDKKYVQVANIDLSGYSEEGWTPIGTNISNFTGTYDGGNYVITGLEVKGAGKDYQGLFGYTEGATIRNVGLIDNTVAGSSWVGGLVGRAGNSIIENSYATGEVKGTTRVGGLAGLARNSSIENSYATGSVKGTGEYVGGLAGLASSSTAIINSYAEVSVKGTEQAGGLVGLANSITINNSYATGSVEGTAYIGGLVGNAISSTKISNSYATGAVEPPYGYSATGGLVGRADNIIIENSYATGSVTRSSGSAGGLVGSANKTTISNSYAEGSVEATGGSVGGLVGYANSSPISNSYAKGSVTGRERVGGLVGRTNWSDTTISNSYATGLVTVTGTDTDSEYVGGLVGEAYDNSTASNSYWNIETTGQEESAGGGVGKTTDEMKEKTTYSGWDFENVWKIDDGNDYPKLR